MASVTVSFRQSMSSPCSSCLTLVTLFVSPVLPWVLKRCMGTCKGLADSTAE